MFHAYQVPSFCLLPSVYLAVCFVHVSVCAECTTRNTQALEYEKDHRCTGTYIYYISFYLTFTASLYDEKICLFSYGSGEINKQTHSLNS